MKKYLFICVKNSGRSQMAEAFFNQMAGGKAQAVSAGTVPAGSVNPMVVKAMLEKGLDISANKPKELTLEMLEEADRVVNMGCLDSDTCPISLAEAEDWQLPDPEGQGIAQVREIRDQIEKKIAQLVKNLPQA